MGFSTTLTLNYPAIHPYLPAAAAQRELDTPLPDFGTLQLSFNRTVVVTYFDTDNVTVFSADVQVPINRLPPGRATFFLRPREGDLQGDLVDLEIRVIHPLHSDNEHPTDPELTLTGQDGFNLGGTQYTLTIEVARSALVTGGGSGSASAVARANERLPPQLKLSLSYGATGDTYTSKLVIDDGRMVRTTAVHRASGGHAAAPTAQPPDWRNSCAVM